jgi:cation diffusion facilitator CzcD-associated flavoprotein CzcO
MLQRSPTYILSRPAVDVVARWLDRTLPSGVAYGITRWKNVVLGMAFFKLSRRFPERVKKLIVNEVRKKLHEGFDVDTHFTPSYRPWDQRLCLVPDGDLFEAIVDDRVEVVTDHIESFTETGLQLRSGKLLEADVVVTATGLKLLLLGDVELTVDGQPVEVGKTMNYRGTMLSDVPNLAISLGYTNASWTLKCDLVCEFVCRILNHMESGGYRRCVPRLRELGLTQEPLLDFSSGYVQRSLSQLPKQGSKAPWKLHQNYLRDLLGLRYGAVEDGVLEFSRT